MRGTIKFHEMVAAALAMGIIALGGYAVIVIRNEQAIGAVIGGLGTVVGYYFYRQDRTKTK